MSVASAWPAAVKDAKRDLLLAAAREEFADKGLDGATMRGIALRAGCTTGAIYPLFDSKEAIYAALLADSLARLGRAVATAMGESGGATDHAIGPAAGPLDPALAPSRAAAQVRAGCRAFLDHYRQHPFEVNLGLYAFRGVRRQGVGRHPDQALNAALEQVLQQLGQALAAARGEAPATVRPQVMLLFTQMIGALVLEMAGRLDGLHADSDNLHSLMLASVLPALPALPATAKRARKSTDKPTGKPSDRPTGKPTEAPPGKRTDDAVFPGSQPTRPTRPPRRPRRS